MQGGFSLAVCDADPGAPVTQLAREHFGALTPLRTYGSAGQALADVSQGAASVAVLPYPSESDNWWVALLHHEPRLHVIARLPFWTPRPDGAPGAQALVVAATPPDASEQDQSLLGLECDSDVSRARLSSELSGGRIDSREPWCCCARAGLADRPRAGRGRGLPGGRRSAARRIWARCCAGRSCWAAMPLPIAGGAR